MHVTAIMHVTATMHVTAAMHVTATMHDLINIQGSTLVIPYVLCNKISERSGPPKI